MNTVLETLFQQRPAAEQMIWLLRLRILAGAVAAAARIGVADALVNGPRSVEALAQITGTQPQALHRLLRTLASAGIFAESGPQTFSQTPLSATLCSTGPAALREFAMMYSAPWFAGALDGLEHSLRTGEPCMTQILGKPGYQWLGEHPEESRIVNQAMARYSDVVENGIIERLDLSGCRLIVDVGGGNGAFLTALLAQHPPLHGIVAELPQVVAQAEALLAERGLADRCRVEPVDMFVELPAGGDLYLFKRVLHNWRDEQVVTVLRNCRRAMSPAGRLVIIESVIPDPHAGDDTSIAGQTARLFSTLGDIQQLGLNGAGDRTEAEFRSLCNAAGFTIERFDRPTDFVALARARAA